MEHHEEYSFDCFKLLICDRIQDPGNLGSLLRTAAAAGVDGVIISPESTDPYNVKVIRGGMGAHFVVSIVICEDWNWFVQVVKGSIWIACFVGG